jgi:hypothetical protein
MTFAVRKASVVNRVLDLQDALVDPSGVRARNNDMVRPRVGFGTARSVLGSHRAPGYGPRGRGL